MREGCREMASEVGRVNQGGQGAREASSLLHRGRNHIGVFKFGRAMRRHLPKERECG